MVKTEKNILSITNLSIGYGSKSVANNINFDLEAGMLCGVVGVNGIGKSTLLRTLGGFQPKLGGGIYLNGQPLEKLGSTALSKTLSVVLTEPPASKNLTVQELIALGRQPYTNWLGTLTKTDKQQIEAQPDDPRFGQNLDHEIMRMCMAAHRGIIANNCGAEFAVAIRADADHG